MPLIHLSSIPLLHSRLATVLATSLLIVLSSGTLLLSAAFLYLNPQIPETATFSQVTLRAPLRIYSADGLLIQEFGERLTPIAYEDIPPRFIQALLDTEDKRFFEHSGIDFVTLFNASWQFVRDRGDIKSGASTITMQLVKNISGASEVRLLRKFKEILLALKIEQELSKEEILTLYLNFIAFGKHAFGIQAAASTYYGRDVNTLTLAEIAMLAGIPKAPESGNPINNPARAIARRSLVLQRMLVQGSISLAEYEQAVAAPITAKLHSRKVELPAMYTAEMVRQYIQQNFGTESYKQGLSAHTTIDSKMQRAAAKAVRQKLLEYDRRHGYRGPEYKRIHGTDEFLARLAGVPAEPEQLLGEQLFDGLFSEDEATEEQFLEEQFLEEQFLEEQPDNRYPENWLQNLGKAKTYGNQEPGIVTQVEENSIRVLTKALTEIDIDRKGFEWAKPYITVNTLGPALVSAADILGIGDFIRYEKLADGTFALGQHPNIQAALVALEPQDGAIKAIVGGFDFTAQQFNHATQARRQPGSNFKPFFYSGAMENGLTAASLFNDAPIVLPGGQLEEIYRPRNSGDVFRGNIRLREALYRSINLVSLRVILDYGPRNAINYVSRFGFDTTNFPRNAQLAFGGGTIALTPLEIATGYAVFANGGFKVTPFLISRIDSINDEVLFQADPAVVCYASCDESKSAPRVVEPRVAHIMDSILHDAVLRGTGTKALRALKRQDLRGKTGTTNSADIWFSGYTPDLVATIWAGFQDNSPVGNREWGSTTPIEIWINFMAQSLPRERDARTLPRPDGILSVKIDPETGKRTEPSDPEGVFEIFREEYVPLAVTKDEAEQEADVDPVIF